MEAELSFFLIGLVMSIPIGIAVNILTPIVQAKLEGKARVPKTLQKLQVEHEMLKDLYDHRAKLHLKTTSTALIAFVLFAVANAAWAIPGSFVGTYFLSGSATYWGPTIGELIDFASSITAIIFFLLTILVCFNHIRLIAKVRDFKSYHAAYLKFANQLNMVVPP